MRAAGSVEESVLVPAVTAPSSVWCLRSLGRRDVHTIAAGHRATAPAFASKYCDESVVVPSPTDDLLAYKDSLLSIAERPDVRAITPMRESDVYVLSKYREEFADHVATPWPTFETLRMAHDRERLFETAADADVPMPETWPLDEVPDWDRDLIVKARYAILADAYLPELSPREVLDPGKTRYLESGAEPDIERIRSEMHHVPIVQEYVAGTEYTFRALYDHGEPVVTSQKRLLRGMKYPRGPSIYHEAVDIPELAAVGRRLLDRLDWHGLASVGFLRDRHTGEFKLLEINPRFWSSLPCDHHAGADYPYYYWQLANGEADDIDVTYSPGSRSHLLRGELVHLHSVLFEEYPLVEKPRFGDTVVDVLSSLVRHPRFDYLSLDDPGPFLRDTRNTITGSG